MRADRPPSRAGSAKCTVCKVREDKHAGADHEFALARQTEISRDGTRCAASFSETEVDGP